MPSEKYKHIIIKSYVRFRQIICLFPGFCFALGKIPVPAGEGPQAGAGKQPGQQEKSDELTGKKPRGQKTVVLRGLLRLVIRI